MTGFRNETPLRGWKEILPIMGLNYDKAYDKERGKNELEELGLLKYINGWPILMPSEYFAAFKPNKK